MVADARFHIVQPLRAAIGTVLYPVQWLAAASRCSWSQGSGRYFAGLQEAQHGEARGARAQLALQAERAGQADAAGAGKRPPAGAARPAPEHCRRPAAPPRCCTTRADPVHAQDRDRPGPDQRHRRGLAGDRRAGRAGPGDAVHPFTSEVTLVIDRDLAIPVRQRAHRRAQRGLRRCDGARRRAGTALHGRQRRRAGGRPAHHQRRRRRLPGRPAGGARHRAHRAPRRFGLCPHLLRAVARVGERALCAWCWRRSALPDSPRRVPESAGRWTRQADAGDRKHQAAAEAGRPPASRSDGAPGGPRP